MTKQTAKIVAVVLAVALFVTSGAVAYAFFTSEFFKNISGNVSGNDVSGVTTVEIASFADLFRFSDGNVTPCLYKLPDGTLSQVPPTDGSDYTEIACSGGSFNDNRPVTAAAERLMLKFVFDVTLQNDITLRADCHIDLNGKTLYLAGHSLAISHTYRGTASIKNGTVVVNAQKEGDNLLQTQQGKVYFDTPYAQDETNVTFKQLIAAEGDESAKTEADLTDLTDQTSGYANLSDNEVVKAYNALRLIAHRLVNSSDVIPSISYSYLESKTDAIFDSSIFSSTKTCSASNADEACVFVFDDLDLPNHILAYDGMTVEYLSSDETIVDSQGRVTSGTDGIKTAKLTATVNQNGAEASCEFTLHVVRNTDENQLVVAGKSMVGAHMAQYFDETQSKYLLKRSLQLPTKFTTGGTTIQVDYKTYKDKNCTDEVEDTITSVTDSVCNLEPTAAVQHVRATIVAGSVSETLDFDVLASDAGLVRTQSSYAQDFVVENYGGQIKLTVTPDSKDKDVPEFTTQTIYTPKTGNAHSSITSIEYSVINDTNGLYELLDCTSALTVDSQNGTLKVVTGKNPLNFVQTVQLNCLFVFEDGTTADIQVPIKCESDTGDNVSGFLAYYNFYDQMFFATTGCYTVKTFTMPFATGDLSSDYVVCYDMLQYDQDGTTIWNGVKGIKVSLYYGGVDHPLFDSSLLQTETGVDVPSNGYVAALNAYLASVDADVSKAIKQIIAQGDSKWVFEITTAAGSDSLPKENQNFEFVYNYRLLGGSDFYVWSDSSSAPITTSFVLPGILTYDASASATDVDSGVITDKNMYDYLGKTFGGDTFDTVNVVLTDWLKQNLPVISTENGLANVTDFNGLQYLTGTTKVDLSGVDLSANYVATMDYISMMAAVEELNLSNCKLSGGSYASAASPVDENLAKLAKLKNLKTIYLHNASNSNSNANNIYSFEFLSGISTLNRAYVANNLSPSTVDGVFYGSEGLVNMEYFNDLSDSGVSVYNQFSGSAHTLFTEAVGMNDFKILKGIEYQRKLKEGADISVVYAPFQNASVDDFGLATSYDTGGRVTNQSLSWGYDGDDATTATQFYVRYGFTLGGTTITVKVNFGVVRVAANQGGQL